MAGAECRVAPAAPAPSSRPGRVSRATLMALTARDRAILELEQGWWLLPSSKAAAVRDRLGISPTRYYALLNLLIDDPEAAAHDPLVVHRLRRARTARRRARVEGRRLGHGR